MPNSTEERPNFPNDLREIMDRMRERITTGSENIQTQTTARFDRETQRVVFSDSEVIPIPPPRLNTQTEPHTHQILDGFSRTIQPVSIFDDNLNEEMDDDDDDFEQNEDIPDGFFERPSLNIRRRTLEVEGDMAENTVGEYFGKSSDPSEVVKHPLVEGVSRVGIEIEVENFTSRPTKMRYWNAKHDGSLRNNGLEFVFKQPLGGNDAKAAIDEIDNILFTNKPDLNLRCSTHVHLDVRDMSIVELKRLILGYIYYETFLFRQSGEYRLKSNFCTPIFFAEGLSKILGDVWNVNDPSQFLSYIVDRWDKYCGLNLLPMQSFGSVEFRMSEAKSRKGQLLRLVNRFLVLKNLAMSVKLDDEEYVKYLTELELTSVFRKGLVRRPELIESDFEVGYIICHDIINQTKIRDE